MKPRERKPTERHLNRLINQYQRAYSDLGTMAVNRAVKALVARGPSQPLDLKAAEKAFLESVLPILELLEPFASDAVRLGAARIADPLRQQALIEAQVQIIVPRIVKARRAWLEKMARDFTSRVLRPVLAESSGGDVAAASTRTTPFRAGIVEDLARQISTESETRLQLDPGLGYDPDFLRLLAERGYRFVTARAVEATEHDIWKGDDLGYIGAAALQGVSLFRWRSSEDPLVCPVCDDLDGQEFDAAEAAAMSADRGEASHCRCRCWFEAVESEGVPFEATAERRASWVATVAQLAFSDGG